MSERDLIDRAKNGDLAAFETLIDRYQSKVYNLAYKILCNYDDAADAAQDALVKIYKNINSFQGKSQFSTWIYRITYNVCLDRIRQRKNVFNDELDEAIPDSGLTPHATAEKNERIDKIYEAINTLSVEHRTAVVMRDVNGHSYEEISQILGCSVGTVKSRINRGRERLKKILSDYLEQNTDDKRQNK